MTAVLDRSGPRLLRSSLLSLFRPLQASRALGLSSARPLRARCVTDPFRCVTYPFRCVTYPFRCVAYPFSCVTDPFSCVTDPFRCVTDPSICVTDPFRCVTDPFRFAAAPVVLFTQLARFCALHSAAPVPVPAVCAPRCILALPLISHSGTQLPPALSRPGASLPLRLDAPHVQRSFVLGNSCARSSSVLGILLRSGALVL